MTGSATSGSRNVMLTSRGGLRCVLSPVVDWGGRVVRPASDQAGSHGQIRRRRDRGISAKAIAQGNAGVFRLSLYARVRISMCLCQRDRGCSVHPASPAPSFRGKIVHRPGCNEKLFNLTNVLLGSFCEENCTVKLWDTEVQFDNQNDPLGIGAGRIGGASAVFAAYSSMAYVLATALWRWNGQTTLISNDRRWHLSLASVRA